MYVLVFLAVDGAAHWGNKPIGPTALHVKVATFSEQESFENYVLRRCRSDLMQAVKRLRRLFWQPTYQRSITPSQFRQALQDLAQLVICMPVVLCDHENKVAYRDRVFLTEWSAGKVSHSVASVAFAFELQVWIEYRTTFDVGRPLIKVVTSRNIAHDLLRNLMVKTLIHYF